MTEYIEREAAIDAAIEAHNLIVNNPYQNIRDCIGAIPAADVAPVVRCKDCKHRRDDDFCGGRGWPAQLVTDDGYCDKGRRQNETDN